MRYLCSLLALLVLPFTLQAQTLPQTNLPIIIINSSGTIGNNQIPGTMKIIANNSGLNHPNDAPAFEGNIGIKQRGASSNPKRSFNVETWTNIIEQSLDTSLLGMPSENDWVLLSVYTDRSLMRDLIGYHIYEQMGYYAPRMRLVEVILNSNYEGVYLFGERIKRDNERVDIATLKVTDFSGEELTGGYIFKIDNDNDDYWTSSFAPPYGTAGQDIRFHYVEPDDNTITPVQKVYIKSFTDSFEVAMDGPNYQDTANGWRKFAGHNSFEDFFVFNEVIKSRDAYRRSTFMHKDKNKKLRMGPVWDVELSLYNTADCNASQSTGWAYMYGQTCNTSTYLPPFWWEKLATDTAFMYAAKCKYTMYRNSFLDTTALFGFIDSISALLNAEQAQDRNFQKWPIFGTPLVNEPTPMAANHAEEVARIKTFLRARLQFLDAQWLSPGCVLSVPQPETVVNHVQFFPNPTSDVLNMVIETGKTGTVQVQIRDIMGRVIRSFDHKAVQAGAHRFTYSLADLQPGLYHLTVIQGNERTATYKIMKQ